ncbi:replication factor A [Haladaptatus sp. NG-WS-4]
MTESELRQQAEEIADQLTEAVDVASDDIEDRLTTLVKEYKVPLEEARRSIISTYLDENDIDRNDLESDNQEVDLADIDEPDQWVDVTAKVVDLWDPRSDAIAQVGLLGDETGTIKFTKWAKSDLPALAEGSVYSLGNVVTDEYQGQYSVKLNRTTTVEEIDRDIEVGDNEIEVTGALVDIQSGSGMIKRCPEDDCTRVLQNGRCSEHGEGDGEFDLRIKGVLDDGDTVQDVIFNQEMTEAVSDLTLESAKEMAMDALDTSVVADTLRDETLGCYYRVTGPVFGRYVLANEVERVENVGDPTAILTRARSI